MADNFLISTLGGDESVAADEIASVKYQRLKQIFGPDGIQEGEVGLASTTVVRPLPVNAYPASDYLMVAGLGIAPSFASFALAASGDLVTAVATKQIRVIALALMATAEGTIKFQSGASSDLTGTLNIADAIPFVLPFNPAGWFETVVGEKLNLVIETSNPVGGCLTYIKV